MTITEAHDVSTLLKLIGTARPVTADEVVAAAARLEERVHKALMASPNVDSDVVRDCVGLLTQESD